MKWNAWSHDSAYVRLGFAVAASFALLCHSASSGRLVKKYAEITLNFGVRDRLLRRAMQVDNNRLGVAISSDIGKTAIKTRIAPLHPGLVTNEAVERYRALYSQRLMNVLVYNEQ